MLELQCAVNLVAFIKSICEKVLGHSTPGSDLNRYMALEISWIMVNTAFGPKELIEDLFFDKDDQQAVQASAALRLVLQAMRGNDLALNEIILWFVSNCLAESDEIGIFILNNSNLLECMKALCDPSD